VNSRRTRGLGALVSRLFWPGGVNASVGVTPSPRVATPTASVVRSKALSRFLALVGEHDAARFLDLGPVIGANVTFLGDRIDCKIHVEDLYADLDRSAADGTLDQFAEVVARRLAHSDASIDAALCWDVFDYLDRAAASVLARELVRILRPGAVLLAFFAHGRPDEQGYTRYVIAGDEHLQYEPYPGAARRGPGLENREILVLFNDLRIVESVMLPSGIREMLFEKPLRVSEGGPPDARAERSTA